MISNVFIGPLYSVNRTKLSNNLYRKCYWYFIKNKILSAIKILNAKKEDKNHIILGNKVSLDDVMSIIYNHLCIEKM